MPATLREAAEKVETWARSKGLYASHRIAAGEYELEAHAAVSGEEGKFDLDKSEKLLRRLRVTAVVVDEERDIIVVMLQKELRVRPAQVLPSEIDGHVIRYVDGVDITENPPPVPQASTNAVPPISMHKGRLACGSSITAAPIAAAGTMGALLIDGDKKIFGLTNNHVTGDCNHTIKGMYVLSPAPMDAAPNLPPPTAIGRHDRFEPLQSGDPGQLPAQEYDVALFEIAAERSKIVTSMQGAGLFDTPAKAVDPNGGMRVKKVGRTTGLTHGTVVGTFVNLAKVPYTSRNFSSTVWFKNVWAVKGDNDLPFSQGGDSGALVVMEDGSAAVGLLFAGWGDASLIIPIATYLANQKLQLLSGHGI